MNSTFQFCPPMEQSYSTSSEDSMHSAFSSEMYSSNGIEIPIPRSTPSSFSSFDTIDDLSPPNSYSIPTFPDLYSFNNVPFTISSPAPIPISTPSPFENPTPFQWPLNWDDIPLPDYLGTSDPRSEPEPPKQPSNRPFPCISCGKAFTRSADLKRHETSVHFPVKQDCPVEDCLRKANNGFPRRDHLIEHLRSYHHWDVPKRRGSKRVQLPLPLPKAA